MGADNLKNFINGKIGKKYPNLQKCCFCKKNYSYKKKNSVAKKLKKKDIIYINSKKINISSSLIRKFW